MKALIIAFCVILLIANSLAAPNMQKFMDSLVQGGTGDPRARKGKREPDLPIPQTELSYDKREPNIQTYFRDSPDDGNGNGSEPPRPRKGKREPGLPLPQSELHDDKKEPKMQTYFRDSPAGGNGDPRARKGKRGNMWSEFDRKAKELENVLKDSQASRSKFQKRQAVTRNTKTIWEDFIDALQM